MSTIDIQIRKREIIKYLSEMEDEETFSKIETIVKKSIDKLRPKAMARFTKNELISRAKKSESDIQEGRVTSQEDLEDEMKTW